MSLALKKPKEFAFKLKHYLQACTTSEKTLLILYAKQPMRIHRDQLQPNVSLS